MDPGDVKGWAAGHAEAHRRALALLREEGPPSPEVAFAHAVELCRLVDEGLVGNAIDSVREREVAEARASWSRLRSWAAGRAPR